jgi:hypothetical protein
LILAAVCGDAGGAAAVAPVIEALQRRKLATVRLLAYRQACDLWVQRGLAFETIPDHFPAAATEVLRQVAPAVLLTGTSMNPLMHESRFIEAARDLGIPSIAVLDSWVNYSERFRLPEGHRRTLPDRIAIMDERAMREMIAEGFDPAIIVVTGQPAFDDLTAYRVAFSAERRRQVRARFGVGDGDLMALFVSQPFSVLYGTSADSAYLGFDEHSVLRLLTRSLEHVAMVQTRSITLVVRLHPREDDGSHGVLISDHVRIVTSSGGDGREEALGADLVTGMNSALLIEACYLQCVTMSLQPGLRRPDILPTNQLGVSRAVYEAEEMTAAVEQFLIDGPTRANVRNRLQTFAPLGDATARIIGLINELTESRRRSGLST